MSLPQRPNVESGYQPGKTLSMIVEEHTSALLEKLRKEEINEDTPYARRTFRHVEFDLAIGGPGLDVAFLVDSDGEVMSGTVTYYETDGVASHELSITQAAMLWEALHAPAPAQEPRESTLNPGGLPWAIDPEATAAWGARLIVTQFGDVDFVPDRQGADGPQDAKDRLFDLLDTRFPAPELKATISWLLDLGPYNGGMDTRQTEFFVLYMDDDLTVVANTQGSAGYCYVNAWTCLG